MEIEEIRNMPLGFETRFIDRKSVERLQELLEQAGIDCPIDITAESDDKSKVGCVLIIGLDDVPQVAQILHLGAESC